MDRRPRGWLVQDPSWGPEVEDLERSGEYQIVRLLGKGGMGRVYKAWEFEVARFVSIKILTSELALDPRGTALLRREARNACQLEHENVVRTYSYKASARNPYIVMEYVHGSDCQKLLARRSPFDLPVALALLLDVARGLEHAHAPGREIIHRDIKPSNIMLSRDGVGKVMDIGLGRRMEGETRLTALGHVVGTRAYMSPETIRGKEPGPASDVFSLGVLAYEFLTGLHPFDDGTLSQYEVLNRIQNEEAQPVEKLRPDASLFLAQLTHAMLHKDPACRPPVAQIVAELQEETRRRELLSTRDVLRGFIQPIVPRDADWPFKPRASHAPGVGSGDDTIVDPPVAPPDSRLGERLVAVGLLLAVAVSIAYAVYVWIHRPPSIASVAPAQGQVGASLTISGSNFKKVTAITINHVGVPQYRLESERQITATVPDNATTGPITVVCGHDSSTSPTNFVVLASVPGGGGPATGQNPSPVVLPTHAQFPAPPPLTADPLLQSADQMGSTPEAVKAYRSFVMHFPQHPKVGYALYRIGYVNHDLGNNQQAIVFLRRVVSEFPGSEYAESASELLRQIANPGAGN